MSRQVLYFPLFALLALFFGWKCHEAWTAPPLAIPRGTPSPAAAAAEGEEAARGGSDLAAVESAVVRRPLFRPDRAPYREAPVVPPQRNHEAELSRFRLLGVLILPEGTKAIVSGSAQGRTDRFEVGPGDSLPGYTVVSVEANSMRLAADGKEFTLPLYAGGPSAGSAAGRPSASPIAPAGDAVPQPPAAGGAAGFVPPPPQAAPRPPQGASPPRPAVPSVQPSPPPAVPTGPPVRFRFNFPQRNQFPPGGRQ
jgi:hypothetical protein